ncbi:MAG TPA: radical SAM protein [Rhizomicrobium sp.]|jgi:MoaA/NifB/PqqE/SkfB family radical SAM enzyme
MTVEFTPQVTEHRIDHLPVVVMMPHSRCNCRCVMCDIWKANRSGNSISEDALTRIASDLASLGTREVVLSGGEALMHPNLWALCAIIKAQSAKITLLSTGLLLEHHAQAVTQWCDEVIVSLDGPPNLHDYIRGVPRAFDRLAQGIAALKVWRPDFPVSARCVVQRSNYRFLPEIVTSARNIDLDRISFLAADTDSQAFNHPDGWLGEKVADVCLTTDESDELCRIIDELIAQQPDAFASGFISERPDKLRRIGHYYRAMNGQSSFPTTHCNAPWVSTVIESDGTVRPCFFHPPLGNINDGALADILNTDKAIAFRQGLDVKTNPVCQRCVCTLHL